MLSASSKLLFYFLLIFLLVKITLLDLWVLPVWLQWDVGLWCRNTSAVSFTIQKHCSFKPCALIISSAGLGRQAKTAINFASQI